VEEDIGYVSIIGQSSKVMAASEAKTNSKGLDRELWNKIGGKFDGEQAASCLHWVQAVTGEDLKIPGGGSAKEVSQDEFFDIMQNGYFLCKLVMKIEPECWVKVKQRKFKPRKKGGAFVFRNQIEVMTKAMRKIGVKEGDIFTSQDLYNKENPNNVVTGIFQLNAAAMKYPTFDGPYMDGGFKASTENKREFSKEVLAKGASAIPFASRGALKLERGPELDGAGIVKTAGNENWHSSAAIPNWSKGAKYIPDNTRLDKIDRSVANPDYKASGEIPAMYKPKQMDEHHSNFDATGIIKNA